MMRDNRLWLLFFGVAIALSIACSGSTSPGPDDADTVSNSMTQG